MNVLYLLTIIFFSIWIIRNTLFWVSLWQIKEYRIDRMLVHLRETIQGKNLFFSLFSLIKWITIFGYILVILNQGLLLYYQLFVALIIFIEGISVIKEVSRKLLKRPAFSFKALIISATTVLIISIFIFFPFLEKFLWLILLDRFLPILITILVLLLSIPTQLYQDAVIERATKKIRNKEKLLVIGITGSYGKSSTKEYLAQILKTKFRVLKTKGTNNTPIGVAQTIISGLKQDTEIFVVEMGAYKMGEIAELCQIVKPNIGVLTGVNVQHVSLFGGIEKTIKTKYELIESLPKNGLAMFNGNNSITAKLYKQTKNLDKKMLYENIKSISERNDSNKIYATNVNVKKRYIIFDVWLNNEKIQFKTSLIGAQNIENILPGIYIGKFLGMTEREIKNAVSSLSPLSKTMNLFSLSHGANLIDDTFNANPVSVLSVLNYMKIYKGKRILVLQPMIELGKDANEQHFLIGKEIGKICDYLFLTNKNFSKSIIMGIDDSGGKCEVRFYNPKEISHFIIKNTEDSDIAAFEGKEAGIALEKIL